VIERAVYRWPDETEPIVDIQFDPFESPWAPAAPRPSAEKAATDAPSRTEAPADAAPPQIGQAGYDPNSAADFRLAVAEYEKAILMAALERCRWNQRAAATALSLTYDQLRHAMRRHELQG
jgi:psp operon transcriptional activator